MRSRAGNAVVFASVLLFVDASLAEGVSTEVFEKSSHKGWHPTSLPLYLDSTLLLPMDPNENSADSFDLDLVDVDNDGDKDIFVAEGTAGFVGVQNRLLINSGDGLFEDETIIRLPQIANSSVDVDFADINGDGFVDAVIANVGPTQLLLNDGYGSFIDISSEALPPPPFNPLDDVSLEVNFFDLDQDGDKDILLANELPIPGGIGAQNRLFINDGTGQFTDETNLRLPSALDQTTGFSFGDIDNDGDKDLVSSNDGQNKVLVNTGGGYFVDETDTRLPPISDASRHIVLADMDRDGDKDIFVTNSRSQQNRLYFNDGHGFYTDVTGTNLPKLADTSIDVDIVDLNHDGWLDAVIANAGERSGEPPHILLGEQNRCYINAGNGIFVDMTHVYLPEILDPSFDAEVGDIDGDRRPDLVFANAGFGGAEQLYVSSKKTAKLNLTFKYSRPRPRQRR